MCKLREVSEWIAAPLPKQNGESTVLWSWRKGKLRCFAHSSMLENVEHRGKAESEGRPGLHAARTAQMRNAARCSSTMILEKPRELSRADAAVGASGTNVLLMWP